MSLWSVSVTDEGLDITWGIEDGEMQTRSEDIFEGLAGRTIDEQAELRMNSRVQLKLDAGYSRTREGAMKGSFNQLGLLKPMLAVKYDDSSFGQAGTILAQPKYDGMRCLITRSGSEIVAYSRRGKVLENIQHITDRIRIEDGATIDGELYLHGRSLQNINSLVKRKQPDTDLVSFHAYDLISEDDFSVRYKELKRMLLYSGSAIVIVPTWKHELEVTSSMLKSMRMAGYEGLILRPDGYPYEDGKRSRGLVKVKEWMDDEFLVIGFESSVDGWAILVCETAQGVRFTCSAPGTIQEKEEVFRNRIKYIGRKINVQFANWTADGVPFHPNAIYWRDDE